MTCATIYGADGDEEGRREGRERERVMAIAWHKQRGQIYFTLFIYKRWLSIPPAR